MTTAQAAKMIGCSARHVRTQICKGKIKARKKHARKPYKGFYYEIELAEARRYARTQPRGWPRGQSRPRK